MTTKLLLQFFLSFHCVHMFIAMQRVATGGERRRKNKQGGKNETSEPK